MLTEMDSLLTGSSLHDKSCMLRYTLILPPLTHLYSTIRVRLSTAAMLAIINKAAYIHDTCMCY